MLRLIRERYPFPIAYTHKKLQAQLDDDAHTLHLLVQTAEVTVQYLALLLLAQLRHDLEQQQAPPLGREVLQWPERLRRPAFGTWHGLCRDRPRSSSQPPLAISSKGLIPHKLCDSITSAFLPDGTDHQGCPIP